MDCESLQPHLWRRYSYFIRGVSKHIDAYVIQVIIIANHMNGKDTHVRGLKILGPVECVIFTQSLHLLRVDTATTFAGQSSKPTKSHSRSCRRGSKCINAFDDRRPGSVYVMQESWRRGTVACLSKIVLYDSVRIMSYGRIPFPFSGRFSKSGGRI